MELLSPFVMEMLYGTVALCVLSLASLVWYFKAGRPKGLPLHPINEPFWGVTRKVIKAVLKDKEITLAEFHRRNLESNDWKPYAFGVMGGFGEVYVVHPDDIKCILRDNFYSFEKSKKFLGIFKDLLGNGIFNSNGPTWKHQRVVSSRLFLRRKLRDRMSTVFGEHAQELARCFDTHADTGKAVDVQPIFFAFTFDAINEIAFNKSTHSLASQYKKNVDTSNSDTRFTDNFDIAQRNCVGRFLQPWWKINKFFNLSTENDTAKSIASINKYMNETVDAYFDADGEIRDEVLKDDCSMVALFIENGKEEGTQYTKQYLKDMILNNVIAGRDTTATSLTSCVQFLSAPENKVWQQKIRDEAMHCFQGSLQEALTFDDIEDTPLTEAVLMETIRLQPPVPVNEKVCVQDTVLPSGAKVYVGETLSFSPYCTNRNPKVWGEDVSEWKPERWLVTDPETGAQKITTAFDEFMFPTFNAGPRVCLGKFVAITEVKMALLTALASYEFDSVPGFKPTVEFAITWQLDNKGFPVKVTSVAK